MKAKMSENLISLMMNKLDSFQCLTFIIILAEGPGVARGKKV